MSKRIDASSPVKYDEIAGCSESDIVFRCLAPALVSTGKRTETSMPATKLHLKTIALALEEVERIIDHHDTSLCSLIQATRAALKAALRTLEAHKSKQNECNSQSSTPESPQSSQGKPRLNHELAAQFENSFARGSREGLMKVDGRDSRRSEGASEAEASCEEQREVEDLTQDLHIENMAAQEDAAAIVIQRQARGQSVTRRFPAMLAVQLELKQKWASAKMIQAHARCLLLRSAPKRAFREQRAATIIQRYARQMVGVKASSVLRRETKLTEKQIDKLVGIRMQILRLSKGERLVLIPEILSMQAPVITQLKQAHALWNDLSTNQRSNAIAKHVLSARAEERMQVMRQTVHNLSQRQALELLSYMVINSSHWDLSEEKLLQTLLGNLPDKLAMKGEMLLIDLIVEVVPPSSLARFMERLALFSHLPPIRRHIDRPYNSEFEQARLPSAGPRSPKGIVFPKSAGSHTGVGAIQLPAVRIEGAVRKSSLPSSPKSNPSPRRVY